jgi:predicted nucleic acid-binding protein
MILVDTSVWIEFFNGIGATGVRMLEELIEWEEDVCISDYILTEVLQGFKRDRDFELAQRVLIPISKQPRFTASAANKG